MTTTSEYLDKARKNVEDARAVLAGGETRTTPASYALCDVARFDPQIARGRTAVIVGDLDLHLTLGGLAQIAYANETTEQVRAALKAYGEWLIQVAEHAR